MKEDIKYKIEWIKKDLKNNMRLLDTFEKQIIFLNDQLREIYNLALSNNPISDNIKNSAICMTIQKYRMMQEKEEEKAIVCQQKLQNGDISMGEYQIEQTEIQLRLMKNMNNIHEHLMKEL